MAAWGAGSVEGRPRSLGEQAIRRVAHGLARDCVANCDNLFTIPKQALRQRRGSLGPEEISRLNSALRIALELD